MSWTWYHAVDNARELAEAAKKSGRGGTPRVLEGRGPQPRELPTLRRAHALRGLWACHPADNHTPMNLAFDVRGRLWVTDTVEDRTVARLSPMPANLADQVPESDFHDLLAYLLARAKDRP